MAKNELKGTIVAGAVFLGEVAQGTQTIPELVSALIDMQADLLKEYAANKGVNLEAGNRNKHTRSNP